MDLDGTLLDLQLHLDPRDVDALGRARAAGLTVVASTGRPFPGALPWIRRLGLEGPFICYQGAEVRAHDGRVLLDHGLPHELAMEVVGWCRQRDLHVQGYRDDRLLVEKDRPEARAYSQHSGMPINVVADLDQALGPTTPKLVIVAAADVAERTLPEVREQWQGRLYVATSLPTYIEITSPLADKQRALQFICDRLGVGRAETVAVGDGRNDLPMIGWAGLGVAVEGAPPEVAAAAQRVIPGPGRGGIAALVDTLLSMK